jgi:hypothetical protein
MSFTLPISSFTMDALANPIYLALRLSDANTDNAHPILLALIGIHSLEGATALNKYFMDHRYFAYPHGDLADVLRYTVKSLEIPGQLSLHVVRQPISCKTGPCRDLLQDITKYVISDGYSSKKVNKQMADGLTPQPFLPYVLAERLIKYCEWEPTATEEDDYEVYGFDIKPATFTVLVRGRYSGDELPSEPITVATVWAALEHFGFSEQKNVPELTSLLSQVSPFQQHLAEVASAVDFVVNGSTTLGPRQAAEQFAHNVAANRAAYGNPRSMPMIRHATSPTGPVVIWKPTDTVQDEYVAGVDPIDENAPIAIYKTQPDGTHRRVQ